MHSGTPGQSQQARISAVDACCRAGDLVVESCSGEVCLYLSLPCRGRAQERRHFMTDSVPSSHKRALVADDKACVSEPTYPSRLPSWPMRKTVERHDSACFRRFRRFCSRYRHALRVRRITQADPGVGSRSRGLRAIAYTAHTLPDERANVVAVVNDPPGKPIAFQAVEREPEFGPVPSSEAVGALNLLENSDCAGAQPGRI